MTKSIINAILELSRVVSATPNSLKMKKILFVFATMLLLVVPAIGQNQGLNFDYCNGDEFVARIDTTNQRLVVDVCVGWDPANRHPLGEGWKSASITWWPDLMSNKSATWIPSGNTLFFVEGDSILNWDNMAERPSQWMYVAKDRSRSDDSALVDFGFHLPVVGLTTLAEQTFQVEFQLNPGQFAALRNHGLIPDNLCLGTALMVHNLR